MRFARDGGKAVFLVGDPRTKPRSRRARRVAVALGLLTTGVTLGAVPLAEHLVTRELQALGQRAGRSITVRRTDVHVWPALRVELGDLRVEGPAGDDLVRARALSVEVAWGPLLRERRLDVRAVTVVAPTLTWNLAANVSPTDELERWRRAAGPRERSEGRPEPRIGRVSVREGAVRISRGEHLVGDGRFDLSLDAAPHDRYAWAVSARATAVETPWRARGPVALSVTGDGSLAPRSRTLDVAHVEVRSGELGLRGDAQVSAGETPTGDVSLRTAGARIESLLPWLPAGFLEERGVRASGAFELRARLSARAQSVAVETSLTLDDADIATRDLVKPRGTALAAELHGLARPGGGLDVERASARFGSVSAEMRPSRFERGALSTEVGVRVPEVSQVAAWAPASRDALRGVRGALALQIRLSRTSDATTAEVEIDAPALSVRREGVTVDGPVASRARIEERGGSRAVGVSLDATRAEVRVRDLVRKARGVPFVARARVIPGAPLRVTDASVTAPGLRADFGLSVSSTRVALQTGHTELDVPGLARWIPAVATRVPAGLRDARATLRGEVHVRRDTRHVDVSLPAFTARASAGELNGSLALNGEGSSSRARIAVRGALDPVALGAQEGLFRTRDVPFDVNADVAVAGERVTLERAHLATRGLTFDGEVAVTRGSSRVRLRNARVRVEADALRTLVTRVPEGAAGLSARGVLDAELDREQPEAGFVHAREIDLRAPSAHVRGEVQWDGLGPRGRVRFALDAPRVTLPERARQEEHHDPPGFNLPAWARTIDASGTLRVGALRAGSRTFEQVDVDATLARGALTLRRGRFRIGGGEVNADGSHAALNDAGVTLHARVQTGWIRLEQVVTPDPGSTPAPRGRVLADLSLDGSGRDPDALRRSLRGRVGLLLHDVRVTPHARPRVRITNRLLARFAERPPDDRPPSEVHIAHAHGLFDVANERWTTASPFLADTGFGAVSLHGQFNSGARFELEGQLELDPAALQEMTRGQLAPDGVLPLAVRIQGAPGTIDLELLEPASAVRALLRARVRAAMGRGVTHEP